MFAESHYLLHRQTYKQVKKTDGLGYISLFTNKTIAKLIEMK